MESLKRKTHDDIIRRWFAVRTPGSELYGRPDYDDSHIQSVKTGGWNRPDELQSYGPHFPLVNAIRDRRTGKVRLWLLNGDTWRGASGFGNSTSSQQNMVRGLAEATGIPTIILPHSALNAARIEFASIRPLAVDADEWHAVEFRTNEFPADAKWEPRHEWMPGTGYGVHGNGMTGPVEYPTWESIPEDIRAYFDSEGRALPMYYLPKTSRQVFGRTVTDYLYPTRDYVNGNIEFPKDHPSAHPHAWRKSFYVPPVFRYAGKRLVGRHGEYTVNDDGSYSQTRHVHQLGQSVFRAAYRGNNGKRYFANFLSGIDNTPTGSGYFLVQLPKRADVSSVSAAIESLKPETVRTAEEMGIEVSRQGDLFAIPTEFNVRALRKLGADIRMSRMASEERRAAIRQKWEDRFTLALMELGMPTHIWEYRHAADSVQRRKYRSVQAHYRDMCIREEREFDATVGIHLRREVYGTRHVGTDIAILPNGVTLARGTLRHSGGDHSMLRLGKTWHIIVRNTVPLSR